MELSARKIRWKMERESKGEQGGARGGPRGDQGIDEKGFQEPITSGKTAQNSAELDSLCSLAKTG